ncbi:MAG: response regulator [Bacteroidota bacterium]
MSEKKLLLIVDDEETIRKLLVNMLTSEGYEVDAIADGTKVVETIQSKNYDLLILDIRLKNQPIDGFDVLREMKKQKIKQKTLMLSGLDDIKNAIEASKLGAIGFISKPFRFHEVLSEVEKAILK